jgi:hypothetical protein
LVQSDWRPSPSRGCCGSNTASSIRSALHSPSEACSQSLTAITHLVADARLFSEPAGWLVTTQWYGEANM